MKEQKINVKKHFKHIWPYILFSVIMFVIILYDWVNSRGNNKAIYVIYIVFMSVSIVNIYLHLEYYFINRKVKLYYDKEKKIVNFKRKGKEGVISPNNIKKIEIHQSRFYKKKGGFLTTDNYRFYKFIFEENDEIIITSLLYPDFEYTLIGKTEIKERILASVFI